MPPSRWVLLATGWALVVCAAPATAQHARTINDMVSRPSSRGPSAYIGGRFTRGRQMDPLRAPRQDVALLGQNRFQFKGTRRVSPYAKSMSVLQTGMPGQIGGPIRMPAYGGDAGGQLAVISGLRSAMSIGMPLPGVAPGYIPTVDAFRYTPHPNTTQFHDLFGLVPTEAPPEQKVRGTMAERLEERLDERIRRAEKEGVALFQQATIQLRDPRTGRYEGCPDCERKLARAVQQLTLVRDLDKASFVSPLLMAHAYLEQERPGMAIDSMLRAYERNPDLLSAEGEAIDGYFGDVQDDADRSAFLQAQMRRYARIGTLNPTSPEALAMEAYCAWRLRDFIHARQVAERASEMARSREDARAGLLDFLAALQVSHE